MSEGVEMAADGQVSPASSFVVDGLELELTPFDTGTSLSVKDEVIDRSPDGRQIRGIWEMEPGTDDDVEEDHLFVVLAGRATVELESGERLELRPGTVGVLRRGERARWTVHETLRKAYQITLAEDASEEGEPA